MRKTQLATLCYIRHRGKTLLLHRIKKENDVHHGKWNGLGGKFNPGETPDACVYREIEEESGLRLINPQLRGVLSFPLFTPQTDWLVFVYVATRFRGTLQQTREGHLEWVAHRRLASLPMWEGDRIFLKWLKGRRFFTGEFIYKKKRLRQHRVWFHG